MMIAHMRSPAACFGSNQGPRQRGTQGNKSNSKVLTYTFSTTKQAAKLFNRAQIRNLFCIKRNYKVARLMKGPCTLGLFSFTKTVSTLNLMCSSFQLRPPHTHTRTHTHIYSSLRQSLGHPDLAKTMGIILDSE